MSLCYTTGTFDLCHEGQLAFLQACRSLLPIDCRLVVGLVTDELGTRQKRKPLMTYAHRRAILKALRYVDEVLPHEGDAKLVAWHKLKFTHLAVGAEYRGTEEYAVMEPHVTVLYIPCPLNRIFSSSRITEALTLENVRKIKIITEGTAGSVILYDDRPTPVVIKTIRISQAEFLGRRGSNVYRLPVPYPRNLKKRGVPHVHPMLPGCNSFRELDVQQIIQDRPWCTTLTTSLLWSRDEPGVQHTPLADWSHIRLDKSSPKEIYAITQKYAGPTLDEKIRSGCSVALIQNVIDQVRVICQQDLVDLLLLHGDLHPGNICLMSPSTPLNAPVIPGRVPQGSEYVQVALVDWGWCCHNSFVLEDSERAFYEHCLSTGWDWQHFVDSLEFMYHDRPWFIELKLT